MLSSSIFSLILVGCPAKSTTETAAPKQAVETAEAVATDAPPDGDWKAVYPNMPSGPKMILLSGNPGQGAFSAMVKLPAGHGSELHTHPAAFHGVSVSGTVTNGRTAEDAVELSPGSVWTQPADEAHYTGCAGDTDCIFVGHMEGAMGTDKADGPVEASTQTITAGADVTYTPVNPEAPQGPGMFVLSGDMTKGAFTAVVNFPGGATSPKHSHSSSYAAAVVSGTVSHGGDTNMNTGDHWTQEGGVGHVTACASETPCVFFVSMEGAMDMTPAE